MHQFKPADIYFGSKGASAYRCGPSKIVLRGSTGVRHCWAGNRRLFDVSSCIMDHHRDLQLTSLSTMHTSPSARHKLAKQLTEVFFQGVYLAGSTAVTDAVGRSGWSFIHAHSRWELQLVIILDCFVALLLRLWAHRQISRCRRAVFQSHHGSPGSSWKSGLSTLAPRGKISNVLDQQIWCVSEILS